MDDPTPLDPTSPISLLKRFVQLTVADPQPVLHSLRDLLEEDLSHHGPHTSCAGQLYRVVISFLESDTNAQPIESAVNREQRTASTAEMAEVVQASHGVDRPEVEKIVTDAQPTDGDVGNLQTLETGRQSTAEQGKDVDEDDDDETNSDENHSGHVPTLRPRLEEYHDFPALLARAKELGAYDVGVFKIEVPQQLRVPCQWVESHRTRLATWTPEQTASGMFKLRRSDVTGSIGVSSDPPVVGVADALDRFRAGLENPERFQDVKYMTDRDADSREKRRRFGLPEDSPIWPLEGDQLDRTMQSIPGLHYPYGYKSGEAFGAAFALHREDGNLISLNLLYHGQKIWTVVDPAKTELVEAIHASLLDYKRTCAQSLRHQSCIIMPDTLKSWDVKAVTFIQYPWEIVVVVDGALHQGFSLGSTMAEAVNYAPRGWSIEGYKECSKSCNVQSIPNKALRFRDTTQPTPVINGTDADGATTTSRRVKSRPFPTPTEGLLSPQRRGVVSSSKHQATATQGRGVAVVAKSAGQTTSQDVATATHSRKRKRVVAEAEIPVPSTIVETSRDTGSLITSMAKAVADVSALLALRGAWSEASNPEFQDVHSGDIKVISRVLDATEASGAIYSYKRRYALVRLARLHAEMDAAREYGTSRATASDRLVEDIWDVTRPSKRSKPSGHDPVTDDGHCTLDMWERYKYRLGQRLKAGRRWLQLVEQCGAMILLLIAPDWSSSSSSSSSSSLKPAPSISDTT